MTQIDNYQALELLRAGIDGIVIVHIAGSILLMSAAEADKYFSPDHTAIETSAAQHAESSMLYSSKPFVPYF